MGEKIIYQVFEVVGSYRVTWSQQPNMAVSNEDTTLLQTLWQPWGIWISKHNSVFLKEYHHSWTENYFSIYRAHYIV